MSDQRLKIQNIILFLTDFVAFVFSFFIAGIIWLNIVKGFDFDMTMTLASNKMWLIIGTYVLSYIVYNANDHFMSRGLYKEYASCIKTNIIMAIVIAIYQMFDKSNSDFPRGVYVITLLVNILIMFGVRLIVKNYLRNISSNRALRMLIITTSDRAEPTIKKYGSINNWNKEIIGVAVMNKDMKGQVIEGVDVVANADTVLSYIKLNAVDEVYISVADSMSGEFSGVVMQLEDMGVTVHLRLEMMDEYKDFDIRMEKLDGTTVVTFDKKVYDVKQLAIKRLIDIVSSIVGLIITGIAFIFVAPAIKIESKGPIFFKQMRVGRNGRTFYAYKFRSMYIDAEERKKELMAQNEMSGLMFKMTNDPRITKVGKFIRKTSIDELPQFLNVLKGDMSLVGTRPPTVGEFKQYEGHQKRRLAMKPGITGMWQAYGRKTVKDFDQIVAMDLDYIDNWSIGLDIKIVLKTFQSVFQGG